LAANAAVPPLLAAVDPDLMRPPVNVLRVSLHPRGLAPLIVNLAAWREHLLERLRRQARITRDPALDGLLREVSAYPGGAARDARPMSGGGEDVAVLLRLRTQRGTMSLLSAVTVFGTAVEITLAELTLEAFYPADEPTRRLLTGG
ncbi:MAG: transcriptional regulator, partial [Acetobacteraceae bacterium]|nr:transcriptional regulator [Acetobacteraceae bacterium]